MKRRFFSLVEVLLAASLFAIIASLLFFWLRYSHLDRKRGEVLKQEYLALHAADKVLNRAFLTVKPTSIFFTSSSVSQRGETLVFSFDHGVDPDPLLSGEVIGRLFYEPEQKALMLALFPLPEKGKLRGKGKCCPLLGHVEEVRFEFFFPPLNDLTVSPERIGKEFPKIGWQEVWNREYKAIPALIKIHVKRESGFSKEKEVFTLAYDLPHFLSPIKRVRCIP